MVSNMLGVGCTPPAKGLSAINTTTDRCVPLLLYAVVVAALLLPLLLFFCPPADW